VIKFEDINLTLTEHGKAEVAFKWGRKRGESGVASRIDTPRKDDDVQQKTVF
jgi:hypothetical protein